MLVYLLFIPLVGSVDINKLPVLDARVDHIEKNMNIDFKKNNTVGKLLETNDLDLSTQLTELRDLARGITPTGQAYLGWRGDLSNIDGYGTGKRVKDTFWKSYGYQLLTDGDPDFWLVDTSQTRGKKMWLKIDLGGCFDIDSMVLTVPGPRYMFSEVKVDILQRIGYFHHRAGYWTFEEENKHIGNFRTPDPCNVGKNFRFPIRWKVVGQKSTKSVTITIDGHCVDWKTRWPDAGRPDLYAIRSWEIFGSDHAMQTQGRCNA